MYIIFLFDRNLILSFVCVGARSAIPQRNNNREGNGERVGVAWLLKPNLTAMHAKLAGVAWKPCDVHDLRGRRTTRVGDHLCFIGQVEYSLHLSTLYQPNLETSLPCLTSPAPEERLLCSLLSFLE